MRPDQLAAQWDALDKPIEAAQAYEEALTDSEVIIDTYLKLAVLYFVCNDGGYAAYHKLSLEFVNKAWDRMFQLLDEAEKRFGRQGEIDFWRHYFKFILLGEDPAYESSESLVLNNITIIPSFHLLTSPQSKQYWEQAEQLLELVTAGSTVKDRYIRSVLKSAMLRLAR